MSAKRERENGVSGFWGAHSTVFSGVAMTRPHALLLLLLGAYLLFFLPHAEGT